jgi:TatD DNase family protein
MLIDTHAHLDFPDFAPDLGQVLARAAAAGVDRIITIGTSVESSRRAVELAKASRRGDLTLPDAPTLPRIFAAVGVHPNSAGEAERHFIEELRDLAKHPEVVAIGEIGGDNHRPSADEKEAAETRAVQADVFRLQLDLAAELGLNAVVHERDAWQETLGILAPYHGRLRTVFHCFGKGIENASHLLEQNHLVSFTGILTFKNAATVQETARWMPDGQFLLETDCPFLAPVPRRGKRCEPADTRLVAEFIAGLRHTSLEAVAQQTTAQAETFFRFPN